MKRMNWKWIIVAACLLLATLAACGATADGTCGTLNWTYSSGTLTITGNGVIPNYAYYDADPKYDEPEEVDSPWWSLRGSITRIVIGEGVTSIGSNAFYKCYALTDVSLPTTLASIRSSAFEYTSALRSVTLPEGLVSIGMDAFRGSGLTGTVTLPNTLETMDSYALSASGITEVVFGTGLTSMYQSSVPASATLTGVNGANGTTGDLTWCLAGHVLVIRGSGEMPIYHKTAETYKGQVLSYSYDMPWYDYRSSVQHILICTGVTSVSQYAFHNCYNATGATLPGGITKIGASAFDHCNRLVTLTLPSSVNQIGASAFEGCSSLTKIDIPNGVTVIPGNAFYNCSAMTWVSIPESVTSFGSNAFYNCKAITHVLYKCTSISSSTQYGSYAGNWAFLTFNGAYSNPMAESSQAILYVGGFRMNEVHLSSDSASVSPWAFYGCQNSFKIVGNGGYTGTIGQYAFYNCVNMTAIDMPSSVQRIEQYAFYNCASVTYTYMLFDGLTYIGDYAFANCSGITAIDQNVYTTRPLTYVGKDAFYNCTGLTSMRMNLSGGTVNAYAFSGCSALNSVIFLKKAPESIGGFAFQNVTTQVKYYDGSSWAGKVNAYGGTLTWKAAGGSCGTNATWKVTDDCRLIISGSGTVTSAPWHDEKYMTGLEIGDGITGASGVSFVAVSGSAQGALDGGDHFVVTPAGVLHIFGTTAMPDMTAGHSNWKKNVTEVRIHEGVTKIGAYAFNSAQSEEITKVKFPWTLTEIRRNAFDGCGGLTDLYFPDPVPTVYSGAFNGVTANAWYLYSSEPGTISSGTLTWRTYCAWENGKAVPHTLEHMEELEPTCTENGYIEHWACTKCGNLFEDENAVQILEEEDVLLEMNGHRWTTEPVFLWADNGTACEVTFCCLDCDEEVTTDAEITSEIALEPTDTDRGATDFTATASDPNGVSYTETKRVVNLPARFNWSGTTITKYNGTDARVVIPDSATGLGTIAFKENMSVRIVIIPDSVTSIGVNTFGGCSAELKIYSSEAAYAHTYALNKGLNWVCYPAVMDDADLTLPAALKEIGDEAFRGTAAEVVVLPENAEVIGDYAFADSAVRQVYIPASVTEIGAHAFDQCGEGLVVFGKAGSKAEEFADEKGFEFREK